jgi:hypothetical protein
VASQPHYFKIHLGVLFLSCPINVGDDIISDRVNGRSQAAVCQKADLHSPKRIQKSKLHTEADSKSELHAETD